MYFDISDLSTLEYLYDLRCSRASSERVPRYPDLIIGQSREIPRKFGGSSNLPLDIFRSKVEATAFGYSKQKRVEGMGWMAR
jgi:hypothetical protein